MKRRQAESMATGDRLRCAQGAPPRQSRQEVPGVSCPGASCSAEPSRCLGVAATAACPRRKRLDYGECHLTHMGETALQVGTNDVPDPQAGPATMSDRDPSAPIEGTGTRSDAHAVCTRRAALRERADTSMFNAIMAPTRS